MSKLCDQFKLPIYYNNSKMKLKQNIVDDLELTTTTDPSSNPIYSYFFNSNSNSNNINEISKEIIHQASNYYTTDTEFLRETQQLLKTYKYSNENADVTHMVDLWKEIKNDTGFKEKYYYLDWAMFEYLNKSENFLQIMSIYNMASPLLSLCIPIIFMIIPFLIIRLKGLKLNMTEYLEVLKVVVSNHSIGKLFTQFNSVTTNEKIYMVVSAAFYVFSIYQNILVCVRFNENMIKIHKFLKEIDHYLDSTINSMSDYITYSTNYESHKDFNHAVQSNIDVLSEFKQKIHSIGEYRMSNYKKIFEIGHILKYFYEFYDNKIYNDAFMYSFGFHGYIDIIKGLQQNIDERKISFAEFTNDNKKTVFKNNYYACLKDGTPVKNTIRMKKNSIISGPNASGKTTILKSTLINIIFSQQFGCGFYGSALLKPYKYLHCYLNIPDTSGRDSLFQAEARRCKEILDLVGSNKDDAHFCVFDELYSGTNPDEAVVSAIAFMEYLIRNQNVSCMLTTHFVKICKTLKRNNNVRNCHMVASKDENRIFYTYKLKSGISNIKGGINVLLDMNYPKEIIDNAITTTNSLVRP